MKVLVILTGSMIFDGITNSVFNYYNAMDRANMQIDIVSSRFTLKEMELKFNNIGCNVFKLEYRDKKPFKYLIDLSHLIRHGEYDIVHAHGNSATLALESTAALIGGCKNRVLHSRNSSCEHKIIDKLFRPIMYATYTDGFACGKKAGEWLFQNRPFTIIKNGKDIDKFLFNNNIRIEYRNKLNVEEDVILIGHVGLFHKQKNHEFLIETFDEVSKVDERYRLVLIGDGEEMEKIRNLVFNKGLNDKVFFLGKKNDIENWLQALDIMVFPSLFEGMPNVVLEWQIAGLPSLISDSITTECKILDIVHYLPLQKGPKYWAKEILSTSINNRQGFQSCIKKEFINSGFDIKENAKFLKLKYKEMLERQ